jgi:hypothetical protein
MWLNERCRVSTIFTLVSPSKATLQDEIRFLIRRDRKMRFLRWKSSQPTDLAEPPTSWRSRFNPFSRLNSRASIPIDSPTESPTLLETVEIDQTRFSLMSTPSGISDETTSPISNTSSRPQSTFSSISPSSSFGPSASLQRQSSVYSHRSLRIQRDRSRPPSAIHPTPRIERPLTPRIAEDDCLVLTSTVRVS